MNWLRVVIVSVLFKVGLAVAPPLDPAFWPASGYARASDSEVKHEQVSICFNYGCAVEEAVLIEKAVLRYVGELFDQVTDPLDERDVIARAVAELYRHAGGQTPVFADRAGNLLDAGVEGRMDCIDHSTTTTRFLRMIERRGWLRYHRVAEPGRRTRFLLQHLSAVIEEVDPTMFAQAALDEAEVPDHVPILLALCDCPDLLDDLAKDASEVSVGPPRRREEMQFVVDSWFVDHAEPAVILPLAEWLKGEGPNVY